MQVDADSSLGGGAVVVAALYPGRMSSSSSSSRRAQLRRQQLRVEQCLHEHGERTIKAAGSTFQTTPAGAISRSSRRPNATVDYASVARARAARPVREHGLYAAPTAHPAKERPRFRRQDVLYFPVQIGPIAMAYNLPSSPA